MESLGPLQLSTTAIKKDGSHLPCGAYLSIAAGTPVRLLVTYIPACPSTCPAAHADAATVSCCRLSWKSCPKRRPSSSSSSSSSSNNKLLRMHTKKVAAPRGCQTRQSCRARPGSLQARSIVKGQAAAIAHTCPTMPSTTGAAQCALPSPPGVVTP